jgi:hypothetical protein
MTILFRAYCISTKKKFSEEIWPKIYLGQDPDVFESQIGQKSSGSVTLLFSILRNFKTSLVLMCKIIH